MASKKQRRLKKQQSRQRHETKMMIKNNYHFKNKSQIKRAMSERIDKFQSILDTAKATISKYKDDEYLYEIFYSSIIQQFNELVNSITLYDIDAYQPVDIELPQIESVELFNISDYQPINHTVITELADKQFILNEIDADYSITELIEINKGIEGVITEFNLQSHSRFIENYNAASIRAGDDRNALDDLFNIVQEVSQLGQMPPKALVELIFSRFKDQAREIFDTSERKRLLLAEERTGIYTESLTPEEMEELMRK